MIKIRPLRAKATQPGEVSGPAYALSVRIVNGSGRRISLQNSVVNLAYGPDQTPGSPISGPPNRPLTGSLPAGRSTTAVYVFTVPSNTKRARLTVQLSYSPYAPEVIFSGFTA